MKLVVKNIILILVLVIFASTVLASLDKIASVESNLINISAQEVTNCQGTLCTIEFTVINLDKSDKQVSVSQYFHSDKPTPLKLEKYGEITEIKSVNNPYECNCVATNDTNGTGIACSLCDNITTYDYTYNGFNEVSSTKKSNELKTDDNSVITLKNNDVQRFKATIYQPLGQKTKYDIITKDNENKETTLDPWLDTYNYYINLNNYSIYSKINDTYTTTYGTQGSAIKAGYIIKTNLNGTIGYVCVDSRNTANNISLYSIGKTLLKTVPMSSFCGLLNYNVTENNNYYLVVASAGTWTDVYLPYDRGNLNTTAISFYNGTYLDGSLIDVDYGSNNIINVSFNPSTNVNINVSYETQNLTINSTSSQLLITYDTSIINQINDTAVGNNLISGQCYNIISGKTSLNWSINAKLNFVKDMSRVVNYSFTACNANETLGVQAILDGISASKIGNAYSSYNNKVVYERLANGSQYPGTFDKFVVIGNKRYAFNYDQNNSANFPTMYNITPVFYVWQNINMSSIAISNSVQNLIDSTN